MDKEGFTTLIKIAGAVFVVWLAWWYYGNRKGGNDKARVGTKDGQPNNPNIGG
jgi:threonine/homoserine/homoserine lactone efflux protein